MAKVRYVGDGEHYVLGRPAVEDAIEDVDEDTAASLVETGLYEPVGKKSSANKKEADGAADDGGES